MDEKSQSSNVSISLKKVRMYPIIPSKEPLRLEGHGIKHAFDSYTCSLNTLKLEQKTSSYKPLILLTAKLVETYNRSNPYFLYSPTKNPRRVLTSNTETSDSNSYDNNNADLILHVNDEIVCNCSKLDTDKLLQKHFLHPRERSNSLPVTSNFQPTTYHVIDLVGTGTFGQVVKCLDNTKNEMVAIKIIKNKPAYFNQALIEIKLLSILNEKCDPNDNSSIVRLLNYFIFKNHLCLVFELLNVNLYELIKQNRFRGITFNLVRTFMKQILDSLHILRTNRIIHCDLKPENILLKSLNSARIKLIDFGSACFDFQTIYSYIQSRFYRAPEILLGLQYGTPIDIWSLGCMGVELFLGLPLYPGLTEHNQLSRIIEMQGMPADYMIEKGTAGHKYFISTTVNGKKEHRLKTAEEYAIEYNKQVVKSRKFFTAKNLSDLILSYPYNKSISLAEKQKENTIRRIFVDFISGLLQIDPANRWTPLQALSHPFISGVTFRGPHHPPEDPLPEPKNFHTFECNIIY